MYKYLLLILICALTNLSLYAQVHKNFSARTSNQSLSPHSRQSIYHLRGDFTMIGNTNYTLSSYQTQGDNSSNNNQMKFVDIDNSNSTINSSAANLNLSVDKNTSSECSKVVYAGIYWSGRAAREISSGTTLHYVNNTLSVSRKGTGNNRYIGYSVGDYSFEFRNSGNSPSVIVKRGSISTTLAATFTTNGSGSASTITATFNEAYTIYDNTMSAKIVVNSLTRRQSNDAEGALMLIETFPYSEGAILDKKKVKLKLPGSSKYVQVNALSNSIYYGKQEAGYMYAAFADVTEIVRDNANGANGEYTVADIAGSIGNADGTGYYGGWGMVVIYENMQMPWRDVTMFDGLAYVVGNATTSHELTVAGFQAIQDNDTEQEIKVKIGMMAGEGDRSIQGDYFKIRNSSNSNWIALNHEENTTNNFFNSSVATGNNKRTPSLVNNTGLDIVMFDLPNKDRSIIDYDQTSTKFQYGSTQDTYIIYNIVFAVDAYIPEVEGLVTLKEVNSKEVRPGDATINAGDILTYEVEVRNRGTEYLNNAVLEIPLPYLSSYVENSLNAQWIYDSTPKGDYADPNFNMGLGNNGKFIWKIGEMPKPTNSSDIIGKLTFKIRAFDDCRYLNVLNCSAQIKLQGKVSGNGALSGVMVENSFITGYEAGSCFGSVIREPQVVTILYKCIESPVIKKEFTFCNVDSPRIDFEAIATSFDEGTRFYTVDTNEEIDSQEGFLNANANYVAVPRGGDITDGNCYYEFAVLIGVISEKPSMVDGNEVAYCLNDMAAPLEVAVTNANYQLYYYYPNDPQPYAKIIPSTLNSGLTTYYVAQGTNTCIGPKTELFVEVGTCALPVKLISFEAEKGDQGAVLNWVTTEEFNASHFEIERLLDLDRGFVSLGNVFVSGSTSGGKYTFIDESAASGEINYYRLKMVDLDNSFNYSDIRSAVVTGEVETRIFPNPVANEMNITAKSALSTVKIMNLGGQLVAHHFFEGTKSNETIQVSTLTPGNYVVQIKTTSGAVYFKKLVKGN